MNLIPRLLLVVLMAVSGAGSVSAQITSLVNFNDIWRYHKGTNAPQSDWKTADDSALASWEWLSGMGGFGFADAGGQETNKCGTILRDMKGSAATNYTTVYIRRQFTLGNAPPANARLYLRMDWDDGFIAWLNGQYITNRNVTGAPAEPAYTNRASASHESSLGDSSPQPAETYDLGPAANWLSAGTHTLAIIGLNQSPTSTDFILVADLWMETPEPLTNAVGGTLSVDTVWRTSNGIYTVTNNLLVASNATLTIEPGVTVRSRVGCSITIAGRLLAEGTSGQPIRFTRHPGDATWERIKFVKAADSRMSHCIIEYSRCVGDHKDYYPTNCGPPPVYSPRNYHEAVVVLASHVDFDSCSFTNLPDASATAEGDAMAIISDDPEFPGPASANVRNCLFIRIGQGVHTRFASVLVENCVFQDKHGDNDDVDLYGESTPPSVVRNNLFLYPSYDDRINPTRCSAIIYGNTIYGSSDHGIVLRDVSAPVVFNNVLYNCSAGGITFQNGCEPFIANNTIVNCNNAIKPFDHLDRTGPPYCLSAISGKATLVNNIIWNCTPAFNLSGNAFGTLQVHVSYSDIQGGTNNATIGSRGLLVGGPGNINVDPLFVNSAATNFQLRANSPCLDVGTNQTYSGSNFSQLVAFDFAGTPRPLDGDGDGVARFDIGAFELLRPESDSNGDGIPDGWCQRYGFNPLDDGVASGNPDNDAYNNFQEWLADTNPTNALSFFQIQTLTNRLAAQITLPSSSNRNYSLFYRSNISGGSWVAVPGQTGIPGTGGFLILQDTNTAFQRYYRVGVSIP